VGFHPFCDLSALGFCQCYIGQQGLSLLLPRVCTNVSNNQFTVHHYTANLLQPLHQTLGISLLHYDDLQPLHQTDVLEHKAQELIAKNKELREFYERATEHRHGLQNTEKELEKLENALLKHELELKKHIPVDQMEELRLKFPREAKDCRE